MTVIDRLAAQHAREYESRLRHIDELIEQAHDASSDLHADHPIKSELNELQSHREELINNEGMAPDHWREEMIATSGPMAVWDILAQKIEDLVERIES